MVSLLRILFILILMSLFVIQKATCNSDSDEDLQCKSNEVLNENPEPCVPEEMTYCYEYLRDKANDCDPPDDNVELEPRCDCIEGYLRNDSGVCVDKKKCCPGPNEIVVDCPDACPLSCDNLDTHDKVPCLAPCAIRGCACKEGYVRDAKKKCIPIKKCSIKCGENEILVKCLPCDPKMKRCPCKPGCVCKNGYEKFNSKCIKSCGKNETIGCRPCPKGQVCPTVCIPTCLCQKGYIKNKKNICVKACTKSNEEFNDCIRYCSFEDDCSTLFTGIIRDCAAPPEDLPECYSSGCRCKKGFVRISEKCVSPDECCKSPNEKSVDCPAQCDKTCNGDPGEDCQLSPCFSKGCRCKKGYVRNTKGVCVKGDFCSPNVSDSREDSSEKSSIATSKKIGITNDDIGVRICKGKNVEYQQCGCEPNCENPYADCIICQEGCFCKKGFVRYNTKCVSCSITTTTTTPAPTFRCGTNEEYRNCVQSCPGDPTCKQIMSGIVRDCPRPLESDPCLPGCVCKTGFVRINGQCLPPDKCCEGLNVRLVNCPAECDKTCTDDIYDTCLNEICRLKICRCKQDYVRNTEGTCINRAKCRFTDYTDVGLQP